MANQDSAASVVRSDALLGLLKEARDELYWFNHEWQQRQGSLADGGIRRVVRLIQKIDAVIINAGVSIPGGEPGYAPRECSANKGEP